MKKEYDFSKGVRGKFFKPDVALNIPVYLDSTIFEFVQQIALKGKTDISSVVNRMLRSDIELVKAIL
jgi:hypothetical protein